MQKVLTSPTLTDLTQQCIDLLRAKLMVNSTRALLNNIAETKTVMPQGFNNNILRQTIESLDRFSREVKRTVPDSGTYLDKVPKWEKVVDMTAINEIMMRIGYEDNTQMYEEFMGLIIDCIDTVFYSQKHRRSIYFGKYKALFKMVINEVRADVNKEKNQVRFLDGELYFRTNPPIHNPKID